MYAIPAWGGFLSALWIAKNDALLSKCVRYGYIDQAKMRSFLELVAKADKKLFASIVRAPSPLSELHPPTVQESNCQTSEYALSFHSPFVPL